MKLVRLEISEELHSSIKLYCKSQKISMHNFIPELINRGWQGIKTTNGFPTYNDDGTPKIN